MSKRTSRPSRDAAPSATDSRQEKKRARLERQLSKKHGEVLVEAKLIWNKVREKSRSAESRATLVTRLLELLTGKMLDVADRHDAARVMQSIVQYGNDAQCAAVAAELEHKLCDLSKKPHARFVVMRLLKHAPKALRAKLLKEFEGQAVALGTNARAALVLEFAYDKVLSSTEAAYMLQEFYGNEFKLAVFKREASAASIGAVIDAIWEEERTKRSSMAAATAAERQAAVAISLKRSLARQAAKGLLTLAFVHQLLSDFLDASTTRERTAEGSSAFAASAHAWPAVDVRDEGVAAAIADIMPLVREVCPGLLSTRLGLRCVLAVICAGGAKDRKMVVRQMRESLLDLCRHPFAVIAVVQLIDVVDDTVLVRKTLLQPMVADDETLWAHVSDRHARKPFLALLAPFGGEAAEAAAAAAGGGDVGPTSRTRNSYFTQQEREALASPEMITAVSKKPLAKRRTELLAFLNAPLVAFCVANAAAMLCDEYASDVLVETARMWPTAELLAAIAAAAFAVEEAEEADAEEADAEEANAEAKALVCENLYAHAALTRLVREATAESVAKGADALAVTMLGAAGDTDALVACAKRGSRAATLIGAVLTCPHAKCAASLKALAKRKAVIKAFGTAGSAALVKLL
jgi:pumilio family protein 6